MNPRTFLPFGGLADAVTPVEGYAKPPDAPGIGFELKRELMQVFLAL
jgi:L-alanine-DL-glutamate epimerase-like enolase superfamily enzyme